MVSNSDEWWQNIFLILDFLKKHHRLGSSTQLEDSDMDGPEHAADVEFTAMQAVYKALEPLDDDARKRVVEYISARLEIAPSMPKRLRAEHVASDDEIDEAALEAEKKGAPKYGSFAELYDAAQPKTNAERALVAGYWLQVCEETESFDGFSANKELKNLGHGIGNITTAIDALKGQKPAMVLQLKKSGKSRQARKTYKVTITGIKAVEAMIHG